MKHQLSVGRFSAAAVSYTPCLTLPHNGPLNSEFRMIFFFFLFTWLRFQRAMMVSDRFHSQLRCPAAPSSVVQRPARGVQLAGRDWTQLAVAPAPRLTGEGGRRRGAGSQVRGHVAVGGVVLSQGPGDPLGGPCGCVSSHMCLCVGPRFQTMLYMEITAGTSETCCGPPQWDIRWSMDESLFGFVISLSFQVALQSSQSHVVDHKLSKKSFFCSCLPASKPISSSHLLLLLLLGF